MKFRDSNKLGSLLVAALSRNPITDFPIETICNDFEADAGAFWVRSKLDDDRLDLVAACGIRKLVEKVQVLHFYVDEYTELRTRLRFVDCQCEVNRDVIKALPQQADSYFSGDYEFCTIIESWSKDVGLVAALQLYSANPIAKFDGNEIHHLSALLGRFVETFAREQELLGYDREKVAHEVARHLHNRGGGI